MGQAPPSSATPPPWNCPSAKGCLTYRMHHLAHPCALLRAAKEHGKKLGGNRGATLDDATRKAGRAAITARAQARVADLTPVIAELQQAGVTSLGYDLSGLDGQHCRVHGLP